MTILEEVSQQILEARCPEDVFETIGTKDDPEQQLSRLAEKFQVAAKLVHPDHNKAANAGDVFNALMKWRNLALEKIGAGTYGERSLIQLKSSRSTYNLDTFICDDGISTMFSGWDSDKKSIMCRISANARCNRLLESEVAAIKILPTPVTPDLEKAYILLTDSFLVPGTEALRVNVFQHTPDIMLLENLKARFPEGIPAVHVAWIVNRILGMLISPHAGKLVHGAMVPSSIWIDPKAHSGYLGNWTACFQEGELAKTYFKQYKAFYPAEYFQKVPLYRNCDVYMVGMLAIYLLGGNVNDCTFPIGTPPELMVVIKAAILGPAHRIPDVFEFFEQWRTALKKVYGKRKFIDFIIPPLTTKH